MGQNLTTIGFDADDTLWHNERFFQITQERFAGFWGISPILIFFPPDFWRQNGAISAIMASGSRVSCCP